MRGQRFWIYHGVLERQEANVQFKPDAEDRFLQSGSVRLTTGELGTEVKWVVNSPCVSSLFKTVQWLPSVKAPFILRFHAVGWFEEVYREASSVIKRIEQVLARGDRHFTSRVFIQEQSDRTQSIPDVLRRALNGNLPSLEHSIDCFFDQDTLQFRVDRVGAQSAIGRVWGTYTSSYPCQSAGSYGDPVNKTYESVMRSGKPRFDHVLAALRLPDNALHWVPYQRVVSPCRIKGVEGVTVTSLISRVDIQVL